MNKQVKITINNKECYCDNEVFEYILFVDTKREELEYIIDKAIEYIEENAIYIYKDNEEELLRVEIHKLLDILRGEDNE